VRLYLVLGGQEALVYFLEMLFVVLYSITIVILRTAICF
jgi:hypothetical protein